MTPMGTREDIARYFMWNRLFASSGIKDYHDRRAAKKAVLNEWSYKLLSDFQPQEEDYNMLTITDNSLSFVDDTPPSYTYFLGSLQATQPSAPPKCCKNIPKEKEDNMDYSMEIDQRNHLKRRLDSVLTTKKEALREKFKMDNLYPKTADELKERLANGKYTLNKTYLRTDDDGNLRYPPQYYLTNILEFTNPDRDEAGYDAAKALLDKVFTAAKDNIIVLPLTDGLKALQDFEATA